MSDDANSLRILVVDDERSIADTLVLILQAKHYVARSAYSAEEAMVAAEVFRPDGVISDVIMGRLSGLDLAAHLEEEQPDCSVLLISGNNTGINMVEESIRSGRLHTILTKPVHPEQILAFVATCVPHHVER